MSPGVSRRLSTEPSACPCFWTRKSYKTLSSAVTYRYTVVFLTSLLDRFQSRKHPESDLTPKPRAAVNAHAAGVQDFPNSGISPSH